MTWTYRIMLKSGEYGIHEIYYDNGQVSDWTENAVAPRGETMQELKADLSYMARAIREPVLDYETGKEINP